MSDPVDDLLSDLFTAGFELAACGHRYPLTDDEVAALLKNARAVMANLGVLIDEFEYKWKGQK